MVARVSFIDDLTTSSILTSFQLMNTVDFKVNLQDSIINYLILTQIPITFTNINSYRDKLFTSKYKSTSNQKLQKKKKKEKIL